MNCQKGDFAIGINAIPSKAKNIGLVIECLELHSPGVWRARTLGTAYLNGKTLPPGTIRLADDRYIRPLRDSDGQDESLSWKDVPSEVTA